MFINAFLFYFAKFKFEEKLLSKRGKSKHPWWHTSIKVDEFNEESLDIKSIFIYIQMFNR